MSLVFLAGLILLFLGRRAFASVDGLSTIATIAGAVLVVGVTGYRVWATMTSRGGRRRVERTLLWCHLGVTFALLLYALTTEFAMGKLGLADLSETSRYRYETAMLVVWGITMLVSLTVLLMIEVTQGGYSLRVGQFGRQALVHLKLTPEERAQYSEHEEDVEHLRVRDAAWAGLSIGLAASFLLVTCQVANEKNVRRDVSYFKTSAPGTSTKAIASRAPDKLTVLLFYPEVNEVRDEVRGYFETLQDSAGGKLVIEDHDFMRDRKLAEKYGVSKHGVVMIAKGDLALDDPDPKTKAQVEKIDIDPNIDQARRGKQHKLRTLDREVNAALMKLVREKRKAYLTVGHGEMNDYDSVTPANRNRVFERKMTVLKKRLGELNYEIKELGLIDLATAVPDDATVVIMLAPTQPFTPEELLSLDRYLEKGGRLLAALDPDGEATLGPLEGRLGVTFDRNEITDDKYLYPNTHQITDRRWAATTQFSAHASTTALSRSVDKGLLLFNSGALKDVAFAKDADKTKRTYVIRSMTNSFLDLNDDFKFDEATEKRERYNVGAAIEGPKLKNEDGTDKDGWRAMVFSDGDLFADLTAVLVGQNAILTTGVVPSTYQQQMLGMTSGPLLDDAVKWLGGEEVFAGEVVTEEDVPLKHAGKQETRWFLAMIGGVPALVLAVGLFLTVWLKRRGQRKPPAEAKP
jgi:hypothetical protein